VLRELGHAVTEERLIDVHFHGVRIGTYRADLVVDERIMIEIKAAKELEPRDEAQLLNYLKSAGGGIGFLVNFGRELKHKRMVMGDPESNLPNLRQPETCPDDID
jgi:GxxExxY protein